MAIRDPASTIVLASEKYYLRTGGEGSVWLAIFSTPVEVVRLLADQLMSELGRFRRDEIARGY